MIGSVALEITPFAVGLIPFRRPVGRPEGTAGQTAAIMGNTSAAGGRFEMIAVILAGIIGAVGSIGDRAQIILNARVIVL